MSTNYLFPNHKRTGSIKLYWKCEIPLLTATNYDNISSDIWLRSITISSNYFTIIIKAFNERLKGLRNKPSTCFINTRGRLRFAGHCTRYLRLSRNLCCLNSFHEAVVAFYEFPFSSPIGICPIINNFVHVTVKPVENTWLVIINRMEPLIVCQFKRRNHPARKRLSLLSWTAHLKQANFLPLLLFGSLHWLICAL